MIRIHRPATLECDGCHRCWITHPAMLALHPTSRRLKPSTVEKHAEKHGWTTTTGHICPRCTRREP